MSSVHAPQFLFFFEMGLEKPHLIGCRGNTSFWLVNRNAQLHTQSLESLSRRDVLIVIPWFKSRRSQGPSNMESVIFMEFFLIPPSDYLMVVVHFAIGTRGLNIRGGRNWYNPVSEPWNYPKSLFSQLKMFEPKICYQCVQTW